jgi:hypothetical protein
MHLAVAITSPATLNPQQTLIDRYFVSVRAFMTAVLIDDPPPDSRPGSSSLETRGFF